MADGPSRRTTDCRAVAARIAGAFETQSARKHDGARVSHALIEGGDGLDRMARLLELGEKFRGKPALQSQRRARFSPGAAEQPAWCGDGLLQVLAIERVARKQSRLCLRLTVPAHRAIHHCASVPKARKGRVQCMEGFAP